MAGAMKIMTVAVCACVLATASAQFYGGGDFSGFGSSFVGGYDTLSGAAAGVRDPRANPGPVVFPPSPPGDPSQTSGVVVGASGYGFVPPNSQGPAIPRFFYQGFYFR